MNGVELITQERQRQISQEGWTAEHDDKQTPGDLAIAGCCYALDFAGRLPYGDTYARQAVFLWPWDDKWWEPTPNNDIRQLVKAGALIAAEIDRLQRFEANKCA